MNHPLLMIALLIGSLPAAAGAQVFVGLTADFESGTDDGFGNGKGAGIALVQDDLVNSVLQSTSTGGAGAGGAQIIQNETTFIGDFLAAGVTGITATVTVDPSSDGPLFLRLGFTNDTESIGPGGIGDGTGFSSAEPIVVPNDGLPVEVFFPIDEASIVVVPGSGTDSFTEVLSAVDRLRILSAESGPAYAIPSSSSDRLASVLQIDNITAVPEPSSVAFALIAGLGWPRRRR